MNLIMIIILIAIVLIGILIISDPTTGKWYLILMIYLNYVEFEEKINYSI